MLLHELCAIDGKGPAIKGYMSPERLSMSGVSAVCIRVRRVLAQNWILYQLPGSAHIRGGMAAGSLVRWA